MEKTVERHAVVGISLGPGDPDLITIKGLNALKNADKIYFPGSLFSNGSKDSYSLRILENYDLDPQKLMGFYLPMSLDRTKADHLYQQTFEEVKRDYLHGLKVAIVSEGDASTYSSFSYVLEQLHAENLPVDIIPGITSYALAAAIQQSPLCLQNEKMIVLPRIQSSKELNESLEQFDAVVLMKIRSATSVIYSVLEQHDLSLFYGERLGTKNEFTTTQLPDIENRVVPYFSLMIIKKTKKV